MIRTSRKMIDVWRTGLALAILCLGTAGCNNTQTSQQALDSQLKALNTQKEALGKFAGKVTLDGQPVSVPKGKALVVILYDQKKPEKLQYAVCNKDGNFSFYTYTTGDGVRLGSYVVLFAELTATRARGIVQPDEFKNLFNDPDKNAQNKEFMVTVDEKGKTDYDFNLQLAGKEPGTPGPHSVTQIRKE